MWHFKARGAFLTVNQSTSDVLLLAARGNTRFHASRAFEKSTTVIFHGNPTKVDCYKITVLRTSAGEGFASWHLLVSGT